MTVPDRTHPWAAWIAAGLGLAGIAIGIAFIVTSWAATPADFYHHIYVPELKQQTSLEAPGLILVAIGSMGLVGGAVYGRGHDGHDAFVFGVAAGFIAAILGGVIMSATVYSFPL